MCMQSMYYLLLLSGGEKGVPFRLVLSTYSIASIEDTRGTLISKCFCLVKVFKVNLITAVELPGAWYGGLNSASKYDNVLLMQEAVRSYL